MPRLLIIVGVVLIAFQIFAIVDIILTDKRRVRALNKPIWLILAIVTSAIGGALWFILGKEPFRGDGGSLPRTVAPDDDPEFLERLDRDEERDARIRELEEELAKLDDDDDKK